MLVIPLKEFLYFRSDFMCLLNYSLHYARVLYVVRIYYPYAILWSILLSVGLFLPALASLRLLRLHFYIVFGGLYFDSYTIGGIIFFLALMRNLVPTLDELGT